MRDGNYGRDGVCVRRSYATSPSGTPTPATDAGHASPPSSASPATPGTEAPSTDPATDPGTKPPPVAGSCGGLAMPTDSVRVVDKGDSSPSLGNASPILADGTYALVQATFFRSGPSASPVRSLKASLEVHGPTLSVNAQDTSVTGMQEESLQFLLASPGVMTKTCEAVHGSVSAWFFPFVVGGTTQPQLGYDGASGFLRVIVSRADGATELVFAR